MTASPSVVVVGAGPTGLTAVALLARRGVACVLLERQVSPYPLPRAVHLDDEGLRVLQQVGVAERFAALTRPVPGMRLLDARHRTLAEFRRGRAVGDHGWPQANLFDQPDLERLLREAVAAEPLVEVRVGTELVGLDQDGEGVQATVRDVGSGAVSRLRCDALLGCDGTASTVRELIGAGQRDLGFRERWLVVDGRCDRQLPVWAGVHQVCDPERAATFMQVGPERYRWEFRLHDGERGAALLADGRLLAPWLGEVPRAAVELVRQAEYEFAASVADRWRDRRVFLLGDAAHQTPPFIGQGLGSGLRDALNLSWKLALVLRGEAGESLLGTYQSEREPHIRRLIRLAIVVGWAMTGGQDVAARARRAVLAAACRVPGFTTRALDQVTPPLGAG
ncbi:MAG: bifunctional 3-(3-hydroxy-phenyl)propionate/3-hydroxycinnamic acid hydroxylase, partial [Mycobacteriales bacterium]